MYQSHGLQCIKFERDTCFYSMLDENQKPTYDANHISWLKNNTICQI